MVDPVVLLAFVPAALALNLTPGADMMFCLGQGLRAGSRAAVAASGGVAVAILLHVCMAGLGLGALVAAYPLAFDVIRWVGVLYLLYLAWQTLRTEPGTKGAAARVLTPIGAFRAGLMVNLSNPKVILFVLAFIPQFLRPEAGPVLGQFMIFGVVLAFGGFVVNGLVGLFAGSLGRRLARGGRALRFVTSGIFVALAARLAVMEQS